MMENNMLRPVLVAALVASATLVFALSAHAQPRPPRTDQCLRNINIWDYTPVPGNRSLIVTDKSRRKYRVDFVAPCYNLQRQFGLGFKTFAPSSLACVTRGDSVVMRDPVGPNQCLIERVVPYTPAMEQADRQAARR
ncbi:MAG: hypothetical protein EOP38_31235 [Rubrivivax sp.]|nr:MAG: hypothetical protein EOP38_31235 [Rubrivivax sp.]